jgi:hypothetical protein
LIWHKNINVFNVINFLLRIKVFFFKFQGKENRMLILHLIFLYLFLAGGLWSSPQEVRYTEMGGTRVYFYRSPIRDDLMRHLIHSINHNNLLFTTILPENTLVRKIIPIATRYSNELRDILDDSQLIKDSKGRPIYPDPVGHAFLNEFTLQERGLTESQLGIKIDLLSRDLSLNISQDGAIISRDQYQMQLGHFHKLSFSFSNYLLCKEIVLADWQMAPGTFSAHLLQDEESSDRFLMVLFPGEILSLFYTEPLKMNNTLAVIGPFQTVLAPLDYSAISSSGSWKGKSIHTTIKGVVKESEMQKLATQASPLSLNIPEIEETNSNQIYRRYPNGIICLDLLNPFPTVPIKKFQKHPDSENLTILESSIIDYAPFVNELKKTFNIKGSLSQVFHVYKKDEGFSRLGPFFSSMPSNAEVVIINRSILPEGYQHYVIAEDFTRHEVPWIQMYLLPPERIMKLSGENLKKLSLTPSEEILFRRIDEHQSDFVGKISQKLDILIFSQYL